MRYVDSPFSSIQVGARGEGSIFTRKDLNRLLSGGYLLSSGPFEKLSFTQKGLLQLVTWCVTDRHHARRLDKQLCIVSFDITEIKKRGRDDFRNFLKKSGFSQLHKSVWTHEYDLGLHIKYAAHLFGLKNYVKVFLGKMI
jgi:DNA-binding transcriptional regulator PaaX